MSYYITDNFKLSIGHRYSAGKHAGAAAAEFLIADVGGTAISLFAEGRAGKDDRAVFGSIGNFVFGSGC